MRTYANWPKPTQTQYQPFDNRLHTYNYVACGAPFDARRSLKSGHTAAACHPLTLQPFPYLAQPQYAYFSPQYYAQAPVAVAQPRYVYQQPYHHYQYTGTAVQGPASAPNSAPNSAPASPAVKPMYVNHGLPSYGYNHGNGTYGYNHKYYGRTQEEVDYDNRVIATRSGAYEAHDLQPSDPKPDQMFWCREIDGSWTLRTFFTISEDLKPGKWKMDATRGSLVFIREEKKKKK